MAAIKLRTVGDLIDALSKYPRDYKIASDGTDYGGYDAALLPSVNVTVIDEDGDPRIWDRWQHYGPVVQLEGSYLKGKPHEDVYSLVNEACCAVGKHEARSNYWYCANCYCYLPNAVPELVMLKDDAEYRRVLIEVCRMEPKLQAIPGYIEWCIRKVKGEKVQPWPEVKGKAR